MTAKQYDATNRANAAIGERNAKHAARLREFAPYVVGIDALPQVARATIGTWGHYDVTLTNGRVVRLAMTELHEGAFFGGVYVFGDHRMILDAEIALGAAKPSLVRAVFAAAITDAANAQTK